MKHFAKGQSGRNVSRGGRIVVIGIGPGGLDHITNRALTEIKSADIIIGFDLYIQQIRAVIRRRTKIYSSGMSHEVERALLALKLASEGKRVAVVSSGDPGVYGMAGPVLEAASRSSINIDINVVPGVTAATAVAYKSRRTTDDRFCNYKSERPVDAPKRSSKTSDDGCEGRFRAGPV